MDDQVNIWEATLHINREYPSFGKLIWNYKRINFEETNYPKGIKDVIIKKEKDYDRTIRVLNNTKEDYMLVKRKKVEKKKKKHGL
jgi:hypothetical protein